MQYLFKLRNILSRREKLGLIALMAASLGISVVEMLGISAIMPFIAVASDFSLIEQNEIYQNVYSFFNFTSYPDFVIVFGILLVLFYVFRSIANFIYFYGLSRYSFGRYHSLAHRLFRKYMTYSYQDFTGRNSADLTKMIVNEAQNLSSLISAMLLIMSELFILIMIYALLMYVEMEVTIILTVILAANAIFMNKVITKKIKKQGIKRADHQQEFYNILNNCFGNFKFIKLVNNDDLILEGFSKSSYGYARANIIAQSLNRFPRLFLEAVGFSLVSIIIVYLVWKHNTDIQKYIPVISIFVLGLFRLLPSVNRIMSSYNSFVFYHKALDLVYSDMNRPEEVLGSSQLDFSNDVVVSDLSFEYESGKPILHRVNLKIEKGDQIALIGDSGEGKSTLLDLLIGVLHPSSGQVAVDGVPLDETNIRSWRNRVGYIPQSVYLFDGTVKENVVFGRNYCEKQLVDVLKKANIYDFLMTKDGSDTLVGEGGVQLSGGQRQRIAIARALYGDPELLVLDEATSALDEKVESKIMDEIYEICSNKTLIIVAHRLSTISRCRKVYLIKDGDLQEFESKGES